MLIITAFCGKAQDEEEYKGFSFGVRLGSYFASRNTADFYNGSGYYQSGVNYAGVRAYTIEERLNLTTQQTASINNYFGSSSFKIPYDSSPTGMRYNPAFSVGLDLRYRTDRFSSWILQFQTAKLVAAERFTVQFLGTPQLINAQSDIRLFSITGSEQRFQLALGYRQGWEVNEMVDFFFQPGFTFSGVKVNNNQIHIAGQDLDLFLGAYNPYQLQSYVPQTRTGFGAGFGTGFEFELGGGHSFDLTFYTYREKMQLWEYEFVGWNKTLSATFYY
jgi:hypothetical protein